MPPAAALIYAFVLLRRLPEIVDQLTWNADYVSVMVLAQSVGANGKSGRAVIIQIGWYWFDLATLHLPFHRASECPVQGGSRRNGDDRRQNVERDNP